MPLSPKKSAIMSEICSPNSSVAIQLHCMRCMDMIHLCHCQHLRRWHSPDQLSSCQTLNHSSNSKFNILIKYRLSTMLRWLLWRLLILPQDKQLVASRPMASQNKKKSIYKIHGGWISLNTNLRETHMRSWQKRMCQTYLNVLYGVTS